MTVLSVQALGVGVSADRGCGACQNVSLKVQ
jgi:hypothetical protein